MRYTKTAICIGMIICLAACQNEGLDRKTGSLRVSAFAYEGQVVSRATYTDFANTYGATSSTPLVMPFWAVLGANSYDFTASYNGTGWSSYCHLEPDNTYPYHFYSYLPQSITADGVGVTFTSSPATLTFGNVPAVLGKDLLVSVATTSDKSGTTDPYDQVIDGSDNQLLTFRMDHVLAKLTFSFTNPTGKSFSDLRQIVIKTVEVKTDWSPRWNILCSMGNPLSYGITEGSSSEAVNYSITNNSSQQIGEETVEGYLVEQKADNQSASTPFGSCYLVPNDGHEVAIRATYDVYDKNGTLIRADEIAVNNSLVITRKKTSDEYNPIEAGTEYKVNVQVIPGYLYVLGDDDAGNALQIGS